MIQQAQGGGIAVSFTSLMTSGSDYAGMTRYYSFETSTDLLGSSWMPVLNETNIVGTNATVSYTNAAPDVKRYYRVRVRLR